MERPDGNQAVDFVPPEVQGFVPPEVENFTPPEIQHDTVRKVGVAQNFRQDLRDLKTGGSALAAQVFKPAYTLITKGPGAMNDAIRDQADTFGAMIPQAGREMSSNLRYEFHHPINAFQEHPLNTALDALTAFDVLGGVAKLGVRGVGEGARVLGQESVESGARHILEGAPEVLKAGRSTVPQILSKNPLVQAGQRMLISGSKVSPTLQDMLSLPGVRGMVPPGAITEGARSALAAGQTLKGSMLRSSAEYLKNVKDIGTRIGSLGEDERNAFTAVVEGRAVPFRMSPKFHDALEYYKNKMLTEAQRYQLPEQVAKRTAYQPLVFATKARYDEPLAAKVDYLSEAVRGNQTAMQKAYLNAARGDVPAQNLIEKWHLDVEKLRIKQAEDAAESFLGKGPQTKTLARQIAKDLTPEPIYFPHVFADKLKVSDFIRLPNRLQKFKPAFLKARTGAEGYIDMDPAYALLVHEKQMQKFNATEALVNGITQKFAEPMQSVGELKSGYRMFAPEGAFKFYRTYLGFQDKFLRGLGLSRNVDDSFIQAAHEIMNTELPQDRTIIGVKRAPIYQIPIEVGDKLEDEMRVYNWPRSIAPIMKLVYDKPLDAFRYTVLGFRPGWVLHTTAGQVVTSLLSRVNLARGVRELAQGKFREAIEPMMGDIEASSLRSAEKRFAGESRLQTGNALERGSSSVGRVLFSNEPVLESQAAEAARKILTFPIRAARGFANGVFEANSRIEDVFRKAVSIEKTRDLAVSQAVKDTSRSFFDAKTSWDKFIGQGEFSEGKILERMKKLAEDPDTRQEILDSTFKVLNNYSGLNSFERGVVRKVIPFWSWWKFMNTFAIRTAFQDPVMADLARYAAHFGNDIEAEEWKKNGLDVKEIPVWRRGGAVVGSKDGGRTLETMSGRNPNPFQALGAERLFVSPLLKIMYEMKTGKNFDTGEKFIDPTAAEVSGRIYERTGRKQVRQVAQGPTPDLPSELIRSFFPPIAELEQLMHPYKYYQTSTLLGKHDPVPDFRGHKQEVTAASRVASLMGLPISEVTRISTIKNRVAQMQAIRAFLKQDVMARRADK